MKNPTADVVVIGAGVIGASIAWRLSQTGMSVHVIDAAAPGAGASGSCDKAIYLQSKRPGLHMRLAVASRAMYSSLEGELGTDIEFNAGGGMVAIETDLQLEFMRRFIIEQKAAGIRVELLDGDRARAHQPALSPHVLGASYSPDDAEVNPLALNAGLIDAAVRSGARVDRHREFLGIKQPQGRVETVETSTGPITTRCVINAAGPFAGRVGERAGVGTPVTPRRGTILISEACPPLVRGNLLCAQYVAAKHLSDMPGAEAAPPYGIGLSLGQTESGTLLIGGSREFAGFDKRVPRDVLEQIARHAARIMPALGRVRIIRAMTGFRPYTGDGLPIIEADAELEGWVTAAGHEGDGIALAPITGVLVKDLITGGDSTSEFLPHLTGSRSSLHPQTPRKQAS